jgi:hypothetical protein
VAKEWATRAGNFLVGGIWSPHPCLCLQTGECNETLAGNPRPARSQWFQILWQGKDRGWPEEALQVLTDFRIVPYGGRAYVNALAQEGFVVLVHDVFLWGSRGFPLETMLETMDSKTAALVKAQADEIERYNTATNYHEDRISKYCNILGTSMAGVVAYEDRIALNYLLSRPDVDIDRIACIGLSGEATALLY